MTTNMEFDPYYNNETVAQVREHWKGPYHSLAEIMQLWPQRLLRE